MPTALTPPVLFKCLADETRARVMLLVTREQELCVCELTCALQASQPKISRHLAELRQCGLLQDRRQGQWVYYSLPADLPDWVSEVLHTSLAANSDWLATNLQQLQDMGDRPVRLSRCC
ncbi:metalloregulator ArsR/SmtB family transcription factor [Halopseudomonas salegens]|uniref:Transcriptional regulator, ArsR family n=1 Tax=Halopseudomonas salegens TaxID=1434072 RepID=A0A1H2H206_9GAMM|nr:metalloregulator ArsR/SmtB family transcription factor [Halopseudomonas salegens]SDU25628.1 transcriptional regulator, ArsR family [Halopseudomonas salegens]